MTDADEELRTGAPWRAPVWGVVAALVLGALAGYLVGERHGHTASSAVASSPSPSPSSASFPSSIAATSAVESFPATETVSLLDASFARCSVQSGHRLQLGVELVNLGASKIVLHGVRPVFPLGGLRAVGTSNGTCGQSPQTSRGDIEVGVHGTQWITVTVEVRTRCPAPLPVQLQVRYSSGGVDRITVLNAFSDLGGVPYSGCH